MSAHDSALTLRGIASQFPALPHRLVEPRSAPKWMQRETGRGRAGPRTARTLKLRWAKSNDSLKTVG